MLYVQKCVMCYKMCYNETKRFGKVSVAHSNLNKPGKNPRKYNR